MLKERLYYKDSYRKNLSAHIIKESRDADGNQYVVLDNTTFYPTGGGQPHDTEHLTE